MADRRWLDAIILLSMILLSAWISAQFGQLGTEHANEANVAKDYELFAILALVIAIAASANFAFFKFIGIEKQDMKQLVFLLVAGGVIGAIVTAQGKFIFTKLLTSPGAIDPMLGFLFVRILAPIVETFFFRGALYPSFTNYFAQRGNPIVGKVMAAIIISILFSVWHVVASNGDTSALLSFFIYSLIEVGLIEATGSIAPAIGAHFALNLING